MFSPRVTGVTFNANVGTIDSSVADSADKTQLYKADNFSALGSQMNVRPNSQNQAGQHLYSPRRNRRSHIFKDELGSSVLRSTDSQGSKLRQTLMDYHTGKIMNYKMLSGINDHQSLRGSFRKWTGMPQTTRTNKMPELVAVKESRLIADHRKRALKSIDKKSGFHESSTISAGNEDSPHNHTHRNISKSAWNKIRLVKLKKKERLVEFNPWSIQCFYWSKTFTV